MDWAFDRHVLHGRNDPGASRLVALVASAADTLAGKPPDALVEEALRDLERVCHRTTRARLLRTRVVRQPFATYVLPTGTRSPAHLTAIPGLYLAGDWTDTGLPSTVESAVASGHRAAESVLCYVGRGMERA